MDRIGGFEPLGGSSILSGPAKEKNMKQINLRNRLNGEKFVSDDFRQSELIDGIEYVVVRRPGNDRRFLMRKDILEKDIPSKIAKVTKAYR